MNTLTSNVQRPSGANLVTIGVPIYKRLEYLPNVLKVVGGQDYPAIELIVSDNGQNETRVPDIVQACYSRPYRFRQNPATVEVGEHLNQILDQASGDYFFLLCDDDEISPNFISELVQQLDRHPNATLAYSGLTTFNNAGVVLRRSKETLPDKLSGSEFIRAIWERYEFGFTNVENFIARTALWKRTGGYPNFPRGNHIDNAAVIRLCLGHEVAFSSRCEYRRREHEQGYGWQATLKQVADASRQFLDFLEVDPTIRQFEAGNPEEWRELRKIMVRMIWETYLWRWKDLYRDRLSAIRWAAEAFRLPYIPEYYRRVRSVLKASMKARIKRVFVPGAAPPPELRRVRQDW